MKLRSEHVLSSSDGPGLFIAAAALLFCLLPLSASHASVADAPLVFERSIIIPGVPVGPYSDYLSIDMADGRLFATPQAAKAVAVLDLRSGRVQKMIDQIGNPHGTYYSPTLKRLYVADGASGNLKVFSGADYSLIKTIPLRRGADWVAYDPTSGLLYVNNGGEDAGMNHSLISAVDPVRMERVKDISIEASDLEASAIDSSRQLLYVSLLNDSAVGVVDLRKRKVVATWKLPPGDHSPLSVALDPARRRLYVACRDSITGLAMHGSIVVLNTENGHAIATLPIGGWADGIFLDQKRHRIYVSTGVGYIETYSVGANDSYHRQARVETALLAKTSLYSAKLDRFYVSVPALALTPAQVLIFKPSP